MTNEPSGTDLLVEVAKALRSGMSAGFEQRVAANAVDLALRERALADTFEAEAVGRMRALLGRADGDADTLAAALCIAIRNGRFATDDPALLAHLHASANEKMAIDNPGYPPVAKQNGC